MLFTSPVLIVDDANAIRIILKDMLVAAGVSGDDIRTAANADEALAAFDAKPADVIFLDVDMPGMPSVEFARQILEKAPRTKIVITSASDRSDPDVRRIVALGAYDVLEKPLRPEKVTSLVNQLHTRTRDLGRMR